MEQLWRIPIRVPKVQRSHLPNLSGKRTEFNGSANSRTTYAGFRIFYDLLCKRGILLCPEIAAISLPGHSNSIILQRPIQIIIHNMQEGNSYGCT